MVQLAKSEQGIFAECEEIIERGLESFIEVGNALLRIRSEKLYRANFDTFELYCSLKWGMTDRHARRMIDAAEVAGNLSPSESTKKPDIMSVLPTRAAQVEALKSLPAPVQRKAWAQAVETAEKPGQPTAKEVEAAVEIVAPKSERINYRPSNGLQYAAMAISDLEKIQPRDTQRAEALAKVTAWIKRNQ